MPSEKPELLLHICCVGCGAYVAELLKKDYEVVLFFYNPSIFPEAEYDLRREEAERIARRLNLAIIIGANNHQAWREKVRGLEQEPEKGKRCLVCYQDRLRETARQARELAISHFTTTLSVSPHKDAQAVASFGGELAASHGLHFIDTDFKKKDGFKKACAKSRELGLYRQDYCGCEFSMRNDANLANKC